MRRITLQGDPGQGGLDGAGAAALGAWTMAPDPEPAQGEQDHHFGVSELIVT